MAGRGFAPGDPDRNVGHSKGRAANPTPPTLIEFVPGKQPALPRLTRRVWNEEGPQDIEEDWHPQTVEWWAMWGRAAQSDTFTESDWLYLLETGYLHHQFWSGDSKLAGELRLRVAKFGATPEDRARLRMFFADATGKEARVGQSGSSAGPTPASPYGGLRAVPQP